MQACSCAIRPGKIVCDPIWPDSTPMSERMPLAWYEAHDATGNVTRIPGTEVHSSLGVHYLAKTWYWNEENNEVDDREAHTWDLLSPSQQMEADFENLGYSPCDVIFAVIKALESGHRVFLHHPG